MILSLCHMLICPTTIYYVSTSPSSTEWFATSVAFSADIFSLMM